MNAPKTRRDDVEAELGKVWAHRNLHEVPIHLNQLARTLADEVDARDAVITKLLAMLEPGEEPDEPFPSASTFEYQSASIRRKLWLQRDELHARACEIAGRKE